MVRIAKLTEDEMTPEQMSLAEEIGRVRHGSVEGPFAIWLRNPELVDACNQLGNLLREGTSLPRRLSELAIIITANHLSADYACETHRRLGEIAGLEKSIINAIEAGKLPKFNSDDDKCIYEFCSELLQTNDVSDELYNQMMNLFGTEIIIELVAVIGFYAMISITLNAFRVPKLASSSH